MTAATPLVAPDPIPDQFTMRLLPILLCCVTAITFTACSTLRSAKLLTPETFGMQRIAPNVYVDKEMSPQQQTELTENIAVARQRVQLYYGGVSSDPEIIACSSERCFQQYGGITARANAYASSKLLLSPRGLTVPMITHEWSHAELAARLGGIFGSPAIPRWFDEGLAAMISNEPTHSEEAWRTIQAKALATPKLAELETREKWLAAVKKYGDATTNKEEYKIVYAAAAHEIRSWYRKAGKPGLAQLIEAVRQGKPFVQAYQEALGRVSSSRSSAYKKYTSGSRTRRPHSTIN